MSLLSILPSLFKSNTGFAGVPPFTGSIGNVEPGGELVQLFASRGITVVTSSELPRATKRRIARSPGYCAAGGALPPVPGFGLPCAVNAGRVMFKSKYQPYVPGVPPLSGV